MLRVVRSVLERHLIREAVPDPPPQKEKNRYFSSTSLSAFYFLFVDLFSRAFDPYGTPHVVG